MSSLSLGQRVLWGEMFLKYIRQGYNGVLNTTFDLSQKAEKRYNGVLNKRHIVKTAV